MKAQERRQAILKQLKNHQQPITANTLAQTHGVSRQVIVGDIALLRASNHEIVATNEGYILPNNINPIDSSRYVGRIAVNHSADQAEEELRIIIEAGGAIEDVIVDHPFYGILKASLRIESIEDVYQFLKEMAQHEGEMLSSLTNGVHVHTINTPSLTEFNQIKSALNKAGILLPEE